MLTKASQYAILAVLFLAQNCRTGEKYKAKDIADKLDIPRPFIAKLLQRLAKAGIVSSVRGPQGGFYMTSENMQHNMCRVLKELGNKPVFEKCFLGLPECSDENPCPVHHIVAPFKEALLEKFRKQSIREWIENREYATNYLTFTKHSGLFSK